ncbi:MAG: AMP-binding protein [Pseudomonadota bacterium]
MSAPFNPQKVAHLSIADLIDRHAAERPGDVFIIDPQEQRTLTWGDLKDSCQTLRDRLSADGHRPGDRVAYAMHNGADAARVILGILYGGQVATAVNLVSGKATIAHVLGHSGAGLVFCQPHTRPLLEEARAEKPDLSPNMIDVDETLFHGHLDPPPDHIAAPSEDGLLMYTSGTTGVPKGVVLTQANLIAGGCNTAVAHRLTARDRGLCVLPLYHINAFCVSLMGALVTGGALILPHRFSVSQFWDQLRNHGGTWFSVVPTQISYLLHEAQTAGHDTRGLEALRFGRSASAPLSPDVQQAFESRFNVPIIETMGLTETAAQILSNPMEGPRKIGSPGIAWGNEVMIGDEHQQECARGTEGEVLVRGPNVMRGYRNNAKATEVALTKQGWLRTGDLGRMDEDGYVFITGRLKELIIKGGENIAPREVDEALLAHPDVIEAAAFARSCARYGQTVEAGVKLRSGSKVSSNDLRSFCRTALGDFKCPDTIHLLPDLPKGPSGKIQRLKLAELALENS